jgi:hypothetical protein
MACAADTAQAGGDATGSGDAGSVVGAGVSSRGEAGSTSNSAGGVKGGEADDGIGGTGGKDWGGAVNGGIARQDRDERSRSLSSSNSPRSSTLLHRLLVLFAGDDKI